MPVDNVSNTRKLMIAINKFMVQALIVYVDSLKVRCNRMTSIPSKHSMNRLYETPWMTMREGIKTGTTSTMDTMWAMMLQTNSMMAQETLT